MYFSPFISGRRAICNISWKTTIGDEFLSFCQSWKPLFLLYNLMLIFSDRNFFGWQFLSLNSLSMSFYSLLMENFCWEIFITPMEWLCHSLSVFPCLPLKICLWLLVVLLSMFGGLFAKLIRDFLALWTCISITFLALGSSQLFFLK